MLVIGDLHIKNKSPFLSAIKYFFEWLDKDYPDEDIIFLGDEWDTSSPMWECFSLFTNFASKRKVIILGGNHTYSTKKGSILEGLLDFKNITTILEPTIIDNNLFLPYLSIDNKKFYENEFNIERKNFNYIFTHLTPKEVSFGNEGVDFDKLNLTGVFIHGHIHFQKNWLDNKGNIHIVLGVPIPTRHLEEKQEHRIIKIEKDLGRIEIKVPQYFTYETLEFGKMPSNPNNILNIKQTPSPEELYKTYKGYYIREDGVEFIKTENDLSFEKSEFENSDLKKKFNIFMIDKGLSKEVSNKCFEYIDKFENKEKE